MRVRYASKDIEWDYANQYRSYRLLKGASGLDNMQQFNGELEVDKHLSENLHLVWFGHFYSLFPSDWTLIPERPTKEMLQSQKSLVLKEKSKVRYICQQCSHTWTSLNGVVTFWAMAGERVYFHLSGTKCSQCHAPHQPAAWYPDEVIRVLNNFYGFMCNGVEGRDAVDRQVVYRRGVHKRQSNSTSFSGSMDEEEEQVECELEDKAAVQSKYLPLPKNLDVKGTLYHSRNPSGCSQDSGVDLPAAATLLPPSRSERVAR